MLDCEKLIECLSAYFDGELDQDLLVEFRNHLRYCEKARTAVRTFERTIILHRRRRVERIPPDVHRRLYEALEKCIGESEK